MSSVHRSFTIHMESEHSFSQVKDKAKGAVMKLKEDLDASQSETQALKEELQQMNASREADATVQEQVFCPQYPPSVSVCVSVPHSGRQH